MRKEYTGRERCSGHDLDEGIASRYSPLSLLAWPLGFILSDLEKIQAMPRTSSLVEPMLHVHEMIDSQRVHYLSLPHT